MPDLINALMGKLNLDGPISEKALDMVIHKHTSGSWTDTLPDFNIDRTNEKELRDTITEINRTYDLLDMPSHKIEFDSYIV